MRGIMADEEYNKKLRELQKYVPFLEHIIKRLKSESGKSREAQISKLQSLLMFLTNANKKLKLDELKKCEEVILKLYEKFEKKDSPENNRSRLLEQDSSQTTIDDEVAFEMARQKLKQVYLAPASPSPPLDT